MCMQRAAVIDSITEEFGADLGLLPYMWGVTCKSAIFTELRRRMRLPGTGTVRDRAMVAAGSRKGGSFGARARGRELPDRIQLSWSLTSGGCSSVGQGDESGTGAVRATRAWNVYQHARSPRSIDQGGSGHSGSVNGSGPSSLTGRKEYCYRPCARVI